MTEAGEKQAGEKEATTTADHSRRFTSIHQTRSHQATIEPCLAWPQRCCGAVQSRPDTQQGWDAMPGTPNRVTIIRSTKPAVTPRGSAPVADEHHLGGPEEVLTDWIMTLPSQA